MAYTLAPYDERQYFDDDGEPLAFGKVNTYLSGTTTPVFTFSDSTGTLNTNPVVLSASGRARIYLDPLLSYKFEVTDANDVPVGLTMDPVSLNQATLSANVFQASTRGTVAAPAFSFVADTDTGMFSSAANTLDIATSGAQRVRVYPTGGVSLGDTTDPGALNLRVAGAVYVIGSASDPTNALENRSGSLYFNNVALATGSSVSGTTGKLAKFTGASTLGNSIVSESGTTVTVAGTAAATTFSGSGASLTALPAGQLTGTITSATQDLITRLGTIATVFTDSAFGTHAFSAGGTGPNIISLTNTTDGTANYATYQVTAGTTQGFFRSYAQSFTTSGVDIAASSLLDAEGAGGLSLVARAGLIRLFSGGTTQRAQLDTSGNWILGSTANITDGVATPTIASGFTAWSITGKVYAFALSGAAGNATGVVDFNMTFANPPIVVVSGDQSSQVSVTTVTTTQLTLTFNTTITRICVLVRGY